MTEQIRNPTGRADVSVPIQARENAIAHEALDRLVIAARAVELAIQVAKDAPQRAHDAQLTPAQLFRNWRSANLLMHTTFDTLFIEVLNTENLMRMMLP
jgi:hypothetical protein